MNTDQIVQLYQEGHSGPQIAGSLGISVYLVYQTLDKAGIKRRQTRAKSPKAPPQTGPPREKTPRRKIPIEEIPTILRRYQAGERYADIAPDYDVELATIRKVVKKAGLGRPWSPDLTGEQILGFHVQEKLAERSKRGSVQWRCVTKEGETQIKTTSQLLDLKKRALRKTESKKG
jgi:transposase